MDNCKLSSFALFFNAHLFRTISGGQLRPRKPILDKQILHRGHTRNLTDRRGLLTWNHGNVCEAAVSVTYVLPLNHFSFRRPVPCHLQILDGIWSVSWHTIQNQVPFHSTEKPRSCQQFIPECCPLAPVWNLECGSFRPACPCTCVCFRKRSAPISDWTCSCPSVLVFIYTIIYISCTVLQYSASDLFNKTQHCIWQDWSCKVMRKTWNTRSTKWSFGWSNILLEESPRLDLSRRSFKSFTRIDPR